jgi:RNA polymerase sigma-70 factor (ECF subfamily)
VVLSFHAERDSAAIAVELALTPANVRVVRHRALARLRRCVEAA